MVQQLMGSASGQSAFNHHSAANNPALPPSMGYVPVREKGSKGKEQRSGIRQVAFVDRTVDNYVLLLTGIPSQIPVILLDPRRDNLAQITRWLMKHPVDTVHIFTHGAPGRLAFGSGTVDGETLIAHGARLGRWFPASIKRPTVVMYGCEVGAGLTGKAFVELFHRATGAAIAASSRPVGAAQLGGDWVLDVTVGDPQFEVAVNQSVQSRYNAVLTPPVLTGVSSLEQDGTYSAQALDSTLSLLFSFDQPVNFTANGGALEATLNNGAIARLTTDLTASTLTVRYPIDPGDRSVSDLSVSSLALVGGATLTNLNLEAASLTLPSGANLGDRRDLNIDNTSIFAADVAPPRVTFIPGDGSTVTDLDSNLTVEFSEPIRLADDNRPFTDAAIAPAFTLAEFDSSGNPVGIVRFQGTYNERTRQVVLDPTPPLNPGSQYRLELRGNALEDLADNGLSARTVTFTAAGEPVPFPAGPLTQTVTTPSGTETVSVSPLTEAVTTIAIAPSIAPRTQVTLPSETNGDRQLRIDLEGSVGGVALSGSEFQGDLAFVLPRPLSSQRGNLALDLAELTGSGDRSIAIRNRNFEGSLQLNLPHDSQTLQLNWDDFEARTEVTLNGDQFEGDTTLVVPLGLSANPGIRRRFNFRNFDRPSNILIDGRRTGLAFDIDSETPVFGQLGAGGDIVRLTGNAINRAGVSTLGLGSGGDYFEDRRRLSSALSVNGNGGNDVIFGSAQSDRLNGGQGNDRLQGNGGDDLIGGDRGDDHLLGNGGNDQLNGGDGNDFLQGGRGNDTLTGSTGNDVLLGELGDDILIGGTGQDQFVVLPGSGSDVILDFDPANDAIALNGGLTPATVQIIGLDATTTQLQFTGGSVTLQNLGPNTISPETLFTLP